LHPNRLDSDLIMGQAFEPQREEGCDSMSDVAQGPGWWMATDGKWYSPHTRPTINTRFDGNYLGGFSFAPATAFWGVLVFGDEGLSMHNPPFQRKGPPGQVVFELRLKAIGAIEITSEQAAKSKAGAVLAFGVLGLAAKGTRDRTTILVQMKSDQIGYFTIDNFSAAQVLGAVTPWLRYHDIPVGPPASNTSASSAFSVADELKKLAELRDAGVLTDEEFAAQKARLLG
jgi:Short C-terminal domain